ncbi:hypothetical protein JRW51_00895 [Mycoplasma sp. SG1]|nr:hypothetical protein JRW51_00895 [Mycoplasma sp. SG1]
MDNLNWNLEKILDKKSLSTLKEEMIKATDTIVKLKGKISDSVENLSTFLKSYQNFKINLDLVYAYLGNKENEDLSNITSQNQLLEFSSFENKLSSKIIFWRNELLDKKSEVLNLIKDDSLKLYTTYFDQFYYFDKHRLSNEAESALQYLSEYFNSNHSTFSKLTNVDFKFKPIKKDGQSIDLHPGNYSKFISDVDPKVRKQAYQKFWSVYFDHKTGLTNNAYYHWMLTGKLAKLYKYPSSLKQHLASDFLDQPFYDFLLDQIKKNSNLIYKWKQILAKVTTIDNPFPWDWSGDLFPTIEDKFEIDETKQLIKDALAVLGDEYQTKIDYIFNNQLISWLPKKNKRSGAYSWGVWGADPYILMNWNDKYLDASTLIHEIGHSIHTLFSSQNQPYVYHSYPIFLAEIASITNELLFGTYQLNQTNDNNKKKFILEKLIKEFIATVYRQGQFAEFEKIVHAKIENNKPISYIDLKKIATSCKKNIYQNLKLKKKSINILDCERFMFRISFQISMFLNMLQEWLQPLVLLIKS